MDSMHQKLINTFQMGLKVAIMIGTAITLISCASTDEIGRLQWEINELKKDVKNIRKQSPTTGQTTALGKNIDELQNTQKSTAKTVSDLYIQNQDLTSELQVLTGRLEEDRYYTEKNKTEFLERMNALEAKLAELDKEKIQLQQRVTKLESAPPPVLKSEKKIEKSPPSVKDTQDRPASQKSKESATKEASSSAKDVYMSAYEAYKNDRNREAREKFQSVLQDFPENQYSDNARFWIGESYYREENYEDAILAYEELFRNNPKSDKVPGAMLKQGLAFYALKDKKTGKIILEKLIQKYPDTEQAQLAQKKIRKPAVPEKNN